jgi:hypothetical protein
LGWRYFEANKIDRNKLQIRTNQQKGTGTKMAEKLNNFEKFEKKKNQISALFSTQTPLDDWPDALDHLGLDADRCTKLGKTSENLILSQGLFYVKNPTVLRGPEHLYVVWTWLSKYLEVGAYT